MYTLRNKSLSVSILDPIADRAREGSRYCTGGYIWQVNDAQLGELISGPEYPKEPNTFDGQGMPDMFFTPLGAEQAKVGDEVGCIGVGRVLRTSSEEPFYVFHNREVIEFVHWDVTQADESGIEFVTTATFKDWTYQLTRSLNLDRRTLHSATAIKSMGKATLPIRWFAHPFFPLTEDGVLCHFSMPNSMQENPGYFVNNEGFVTRKPEHNWNYGWYQVIEYDLTQPTAFIGIQKHPKIGQITVSTDFFPDFLPVWGNSHTTSFEPYVIRELSAGQEASWQVSYQF